MMGRYAITKVVVIAKMVISAINAINVDLCTTINWVAVLVSTASQFIKRYDILHRRDQISINIILRLY